MLRHPDACSPIEDFTHQRFLPVVPDTGSENAKRILVCTGKIGHELRVERQRRKDTSNAIIFIDQLYPLDEPELKAAIDRHPDAREIVWVQEEPANMGALFYMMPRLRHVAGDRAVLSVKRSPSPSPSTGSAGAHEMEQKTLITLAPDRQQELSIFGNVILSAAKDLCTVYVCTFFKSVGAPFSIPPLYGGI